MAFPCWDEPLLKATFSVTMVSRKDTVNLSNMPAKAEQPYTPGTESTGVANLVKVFPDLLNEEWKVTEFEKSLVVRRF